MISINPEYNSVKTPAMQALIPGLQWVCYTANKVPYTPGNGEPAKANDPATWADYELARKAWKANSGFYAGIGREFVKEQRLAGVDLDKCIIDGQIEPWAQAIIDRLNSYTEISPSGKGVHIWLYGSIPDNIGADPDGISKIEMYDHDRYFTVTGKHLEGTPTTIEERQEALTTLHAEVRKAREQAKQAKQPKREQAAPGPDSPYGRKALQDECRNVALAQEGGRNQQLNASAYSLGQLVGGGVLSRSTVERELYDAAIGAGLPPGEIVKTIRSGIDAGMQEPRTPPAKEMPPYRAEPAAAGNGNGNGNHQQPIGEQPGAFNLTDLGNAERFAAHYRNQGRWCEVWNSWLVFNGSYWEQDRAGRADQLAKATVRSIYQEAASEPDDVRRAKLAKHAIASESNRAVRAMLDRAKSELPAVPDQFNRHLHLLNCKNGTLDLRTGELRPPNPADMLTRCLKINYNPLALCPGWLQFIRSIFAGEQSLIDFLQQALGMSLSGDVSEQCLFICHGAGSNGKTTLLETIRILMASYGLAANIETFQLRKGERINNDVAELYGARFVTASENVLGSRLNEAFIKKATGKEPLRARRLHENEFEFMPEFTIWFAVNHKPVVKDTSKGMWRRVHFIPFNVTIEGDQIDKHLGEKLLAESEGILAWLAQGCIAWYRQGRLNIPTIVQDATRAYRAEMDLVARFLDESCEIDPKQEIGATKLYQAYKTWCDETGERWESQNNFGARLTERGFKKERTRGGYIYRGVNLVNLVNLSSDNFTRRDETNQKSANKGSQGSQGSQPEECEIDGCTNAVSAYGDGKWLCAAHWEESQP